jgi:molecular chaperone DnaK (HSP70)
MNSFLGIDLGTTHSLAAIADEKGVRVLVPPGAESPLVPSVVALLEDGTFLVGSAAKNLSLVHPERVIHSAKRLIGRTRSEVALEATTLPYRLAEGPGGRALVRIALKEGGFRDLSPEEISARILEEVHRRALAALQAEGHDIEDPDLRRIVLTVPAYFDEAQRQATKRAAELAQLEVIRLINEPTAAALAYGLGERDQANIVVYDLGGGTFDVSVLRIQEGIFRVLATHGDTQLGGDDFDRMIQDSMLAKIESETSARPKESPQVLSQLRLAAEALKKHLSREEQAALEIDVADGSVLNYSLDRATFEEWIRPLVDRSLRAVQASLHDAELMPSEIDEVLLVGGSTRVPLVSQFLEKEFHKPPLSNIDPDLAVALGAARQGAVLAGKSEDLLLLDVVPLSLGIETLGGAFAKLILRNTPVPCSHTEEFSTQVDKQTGIDFNIYQGERELVKDCRKIGAFKLSGLPALPAGLPRVAVTFTVDEQGLLRVTARELRTGKTASVEVQPSLGLSEEDVRKLVSESIEKAGEDMGAREAIDLRNKAEAVLKGTEAAMKAGGEGLPPEQAYSLKKAISRVKKALGPNEKEQETQSLHHALEELSSLTGQLADDLISTAVSKALKTEKN